MVLVDQYTANVKSSLSRRCYLATGLN